MNRICNHDFTKIPYQYIKSKGCKRTGSHKRQKISAQIRSNDTPSVSIPLDISILGESNVIIKPDDFQRLNESDDQEFYLHARFVHHTDDAFRSKLSQLYSKTIPSTEETKILDLCSSWESHLPVSITSLSTIVGHGMNQAELLANHSLQSFFIKDLNKDPHIHIHDIVESSPDTADQNVIFDAVVCCCGMQYLIHPISVLQSLRTLLKPATGTLILSFSEHSFTEKATKAWMSVHTMQQKCNLLTTYLRAAGFQVHSIHSDDKTDSLIDPDNTSPLGDSFAAIVAFRPELTPAESMPGSTAVPPPPALWDIGTRNAPLAARNTTAEGGVALSREKSKFTAMKLMEKWTAAYHEMAQDALALGIPRSAIPVLSDNPSEDEIRSVRDHLSGIIASFVSSGL